MIREPGRDYFDEFQTAHDAAEMWRSGIRAALGVGDEVTLMECRLMIETLREGAQHTPPSAVVLALATCLVDGAAREALEAAAWKRPWATRICAVDRTSPSTRARVTVATFTDSLDGWGPREGLKALLAWAHAAEVQGGPIIAFRREIASALDAASA
jgi:hypothetical protein